MYNLKGLWVNGKFNIYWFFRCFPCYFGFHHIVKSKNIPFGDTKYETYTTYCDLCGREK